MKLTILGNYGPFPAAGGACSSYLLQLDGGENIILDMGSGSLSQLQKHIAIPDIDAVILSHLHFDHIADALLLRYALNVYANNVPLQKKIKLFLPQTPKPVFDMLAEEGLYEVHVLTPGYKAHIGAATFAVTQMRHPVETYGVHIEEQGKAFAYTADTALCDELLPLLKNADIALVEAGERSTQKAEAGGAHLSVEQACIAAQTAGVRQLVVTHTLPLFHKQDLLKEIKSRGALAAGGQIYTI